MFNCIEVLKRTYGYGSDATVRMKLYKYVAEQVELHGEPAWKIVREVMQAAASRRCPDRWFCAAVAKRLAEKLGPSSSVDQAVASVFRSIGARPLS